jgi:hypothetical protein
MCNLIIRHKKVVTTWTAHVACVCVGVGGGGWGFSLSGLQSCLTLGFRKDSATPCIDQFSPCLVGNRFALSRATFYLPESSQDRTVTPGSAGRRRRKRKRKRRWRGRRGKEPNQHRPQ